MKESKIGVPKKDGSGKGMRLNKGRGDCEFTEKVGKGKKISGWLEE